MIEAKASGVSDYLNGPIPYDGVFGIGDGVTRSWERISNFFNGVGETITSTKDNVLGAYNYVSNLPENLSKDINDLQATLTTLMGYIQVTVDYFANFKENLSNFSVDVMTWSYETLTRVVLHTPSFLFDSSWLAENTMMFTGLSIVVVVTLALYEGFQRMISGVKETKNLTSMKAIYTKLPLVLGVAAIAPTLFQQAFEGLNWVTDKIIGFASHQMSAGLANVNMAEFNYLQIGLFILFDLALIGMLVPVLLQNFRRWFELLVLASITPLALACWMFESKRHLFDTWWSALKQRSTVQVVYSIYLLFIGALMFGTKIPTNFWDFIIKMGIMVGGLFSMVNPPQIVRSHLNYHADTKEVFEGAKDSVTPSDKTVARLNKGKEVAKSTGLYRQLRLNFLKAKRKRQGR